MSKSGRKLKFEVNENVIKQVRMLAGYGLTNQQIHQFFGLGHTRWDELKKKNPELSEAMGIGKAQSIAFVAESLMGAIKKKGNVAAMIFYLKTQARWSEHNLPASDKGTLPALSLTVNDPVEAARIYKQIMLGS